MICDAYCSEKICLSLRNITYYVHQNCTNLLGYILCALRAADPKSVPARSSNLA